MSAQSPTSTVQQVLGQLGNNAIYNSPSVGTSTVMDQTVPNSSIQAILNESAAWIVENEGIANTYNSTDPNISQTITPAMEQYYTLTRLMNLLMNNVVTDGHNLSTQGFAQSRYEAKFNSYQAQYQKYKILLDAARLAVNPMFYVVMQTVGPYGVDVWGNPIYYQTYPSNIY